MKPEMTGLKKAVIFLLCMQLTYGLTACNSQTATEETTASTASTETVSPAVSEEPETAPTVQLIQQAEGFAGGTGTQSDPYQISNASELALLSYLFSQEGYEELGYEGFEPYENAFFVLTEDIALNDTADIDQWAESRPAYDWRPIGTRSFSANLDGQGHTISGMYLTEDTAWSEQSKYKNVELGLFGTVTGTVQNVNLSSSLVKVEHDIADVGTMVGLLLAGTLENCSSDAMLLEEGPTSLESVGGLVGNGLDSVIRGCDFRGTVEARSCGGIVGIACNNDFVVENCTASGTLVLREENSGTVGGIIAACSGQGTVADCVSQVTIVAAEGEDSDRIAGGIIGRLSYGEASVIVQEEKADSDLVAPSHWETYPGNITVSGCINEADIQLTDAEMVGGTVGEIFSYKQEDGSSITLTDCVNRGTIQGGTYTGGMVGSCDPAYGALEITSCRNDGQVTAEKYAGGILAQTAPGGYAYTIADCENSGVVEGGICAGGILAQYFGFSLRVDGENQTELLISQCVNSGTVTTDSGITGAGGILGACESLETPFTIEECVNSGTVQSLDGGRVGGILGSSAFLTNEDPGPFYTIRNCVNSGTLGLGDQEQEFADATFRTASADEKTNSEYDAILVMGGSAIGGIVGFHQQGIIDQCVNTGTIRYDSTMVACATAQGSSSGEDDESEETAIFAGAIAGLFLYLDDATYAEAQITSCQYASSSPQAFAKLSATANYDTCVKQVTAVSEADAQSAANRLMG